MRVVLDIGNTRVKYGVFEDDRLVESGVLEDGADVEAFMRQRPDAFVLTRETEVPLRGTYPTMGLDRIAGCVGALALYPERELFIVDFGTAITFDRVRRDGTFIGGAISPGMGMRLRALNELIETQSAPTRDAIEHGVVDGITYEVEGYLHGLAADTTVIFTGGDADLFAKRIKNTIFVLPELVLVGLNRIAAYASSQDNL